MDRPYTQHELESLRARMAQARARARGQPRQQHADNSLGPVERDEETVEPRGDLSMNLRHWNLVGASVDEEDDLVSIRDDSPEPEIYTPPSTQPSPSLPQQRPPMRPNPPSTQPSPRPVVQQPRDRGWFEMLPFSPVAPLAVAAVAPASFLIAQWMLNNGYEML